MKKHAKYIPWILFALAMITLDLHAVVLASDGIRGGNIVSRNDLQPSSGTAANLISVPVSGYDVTGFSTNTAVLAELVPVRLCPGGTYLYLYNGTNYLMYAADSYGDNWSPVSIVDISSGFEITAGPAENFTESQGASLWILLPDSSAANAFSVIGQLSGEAVSPAIKQAPSATEFSRNLIGFGCVEDVVLCGTAVAGQRTASWVFPEPVTSRTGTAGLYQIVIPDSSGINRNYFINGSGVWRTYCNGVLSAPAAPVVIRGGRGFWFLNPSTGVAPSVSVSEPVE